MSEIASLTHAISEGSSTVLAAVDRALDAAVATDASLNAYTVIDGEAARAAAAEVDQRNRGGVLAGVPIALKDLIDHRGQTTTAGSSFMRRRPDTSATVVQRLEAAGAVVVGRTGLHEFAYGFSSENPWFGPVRNPWDHSLSPGGSSGGSAAAVAAGDVPLAVGTDTGGSVRVPAALCGVVGLKVTHGRIPCTGVFPLAESLDTVGPITRTVDDAALAYDVMRGYDERDPWSVAVDDEKEHRSALEGLRVAVPTTWLGAIPTSSETTAGFEVFRRALADTGAIVEDVEAPRLVPGPEVVTLSAAEAAQVHRAWFSDIDKAYGDDVEERLAGAMEIATDELVEARRWQASIVQAARAVFSEHDVILTPTVGHARKLIGQDDVDLDGAPVFYRPVLSGFTALVNQFWCPAIALPLLAPGVPPPSIQFIAPWWQETLLLDIGSLLESEGLVGVQTPPPA